MANEKYACMDKDGNVINVIVLDIEKEAEMKPLLMQDLGYHDIVRYDHKPKPEHATIGGTYDNQSDSFTKPPEPIPSVVPDVLKIIRGMKESKSGVFYIEKDVIGDKGWKIRLNSDKATIMNDAPETLKPYSVLETEATGRVLTCGLGLGYSTLLCALQEQVTHVDVVEIEPDIIALVSENIAHDKISIIEGDINGYLKSSTEVYDVAFFDQFLGNLGPTPEEAAAITLLVQAKSPNCKVFFWQG